MAKFTKEDADGIRKSMLEYQEYFEPSLFEDVVIVGGIRDNGSSEHDIDIAILWNSFLDGEDFLSKNRTLNGLLSYLKEKHGDLIDYLDIYSYVPSAFLSFQGQAIFEDWNKKIKAKLKEMQEEGLSE
jgi:hypothetical protein